MDQLDSDESPLMSSKKDFCSRDCVQFVEFNKFKENPALLAKEVLKEIPRQLMQYFQMKNLKPGGYMSNEELRTM